MNQTFLENNTVYEWILQIFSVSGRAENMLIMAKHLSPLVCPGDQALDLCCGAGPASFWLEEQGAKVTGVDFAPYMITLAKDEAARRRSTIEFIEADIFKHDFGLEQYNLITCFGNSISDFPLRDFARLSQKVAPALQPGGRFALQYHDGCYDFMQGKAALQGVYQETPERITYRYKGYSPECGARLHIICNETRGIEYQRKGYVYSVPVVQWVMSNVLTLEQHIVLGENHFLDIFVKPPAGAYLDL